MTGIWVSLLVSVGPYLLIIGTLVVLVSFRHRVSQKRRAFGAADDIRESVDGRQAYAFLREGYPQRWADEWWSTRTKNPR
jgi:hypothetical protein